MSKNEEMRAVNDGVPLRERLGMSYMEPWEYSSAAEQCLKVADRQGWEYKSHDSRTAQFKKGERFLVLHLARHGGIVRVGTDQGAYDGPNRRQWAVGYLSGNYLAGDR